jgi:hypothetical protein
MMRAIRARRSSMLSARQSTAIISEAAVRRKPSSRGMPPVSPPRPTTVSRSARSFMSIERFQRTALTSTSCSLPW